MPTTLYTHVESPLGRLLLVARGGKLSGLYFADQSHARIAPDWIEQDAEIFTQTAMQLEEYAVGERTVFDLPYEFTGNPFQISVWNEIARIPFGTTISYGELGRRAGHAGPDSRAIGTATGQNPISWIVPCHRVVSKDGKLTGFAGGMQRKIDLLDFEAARFAGREAQLGEPITALYSW
jgi:methylated-DNA-[protein]-cysteine S-methyltransferase